MILLPLGLLALLNPVGPDMIVFAIAILIAVDAVLAEVWWRADIRKRMGR